MKVIIVFGTRPEAIKLAPIIRELQRRAIDNMLQTIVCVTAQHREMLDQVLHLFGIVPDFDLDVMVENQSPTLVASRVLSCLGPILEAEQPDWVLVQGDTTTVTAATIAAFYARVKVGHVEAGLRTWDKWHPFPEEVNRKVAGVIADLHFAPTQQARKNLIHEGVFSDNILVTGNPVIDALNWVGNQPLDNKIWEAYRKFGLTKWVDGLMSSREKKIELYKILVTGHRRENFGEPLKNICLALQDLAALYENLISIVYPVHLNPNVWEPVHKMLDGIPNIILTPPLEYLALVHLMKYADLVLTDSGGIQEEAPALGKPVLVLRDITERPEAVEAGTARLLGTNRRKIVSETINLLDNYEEYTKMAQSVNPYGDGQAAERIVGALLGEDIEEFEPVGNSGNQI